MRSLLLLTVLGLSGGLIIGCGKTHVGHLSSSESVAVSKGPAARSPSRKLDGDRDTDNNSDDNDVRKYGHEAGGTYTRMIAVLVERYYMASAAGDGASACALISVNLMEGLSIRKSATGARFSRPACAVMLSRQFKQAANLVDTSVARVRVVDARVRGSKGLAIVRLPSGEERDIAVTHDSGDWKVDSLFDSGMI